MPGAPFYYVPIDYAEAVGWAAIGWANLETSIDILLVIAARTLNRAPDTPQAHSTKLDYLQALALEPGLQQSWRDDLDSIARAAREFRQDLDDAIHGTLFGRGVDSTALELRMLYNETQPGRIMSRMTKAKIDRISEGMTLQTRRAISVAMRMRESIRRAESRDAS